MSKGFRPSPMPLWTLDAWREAHDAAWPTTERRDRALARAIPGGKQYVGLGHRANHLMCALSPGASLSMEAQVARRMPAAVPSRPPEGMNEPTVNGPASR